MLEYALYFLIGGACYGAYLAYRHWTNQPPKFKVALFHGPIGFIGILFLIAHLSKHGLSVFPLLATLILAGGAMFGVGMIVGHKTGQAIPRPIIIIHMLAGLTGIILVWYSLKLMNTQ